jgi:hypothetical protein
MLLATFRRMIQVDVWVKRPTTTLKSALVSFFLLEQGEACIKYGVYMQPYIIQVSAGLQSPQSFLGDLFW